MQGCRAEAEKVLQQATRAGLGGSKPLQARGDEMVWLKRQEQTNAGHTALVGLMDALLHLQQGLAGDFDVMGPASFQLARYPGNEARYVRHADASDSSPARSLTAIYYLNPDWDSKLHGGQLCLYHKPTGDQGQACGEQATLVAPAGDTLVIFDSHMEHEVFPSFADRYALTVWFSRKKKTPDRPHSHDDQAHKSPTAKPAQHAPGSSNQATGSADETELAQHGSSKAGARPGSATESSHHTSSAHDLFDQQAADRQNSHGTATPSDDTLLQQNKSPTAQPSQGNRQAPTPCKGRITKPGCIFASIAAYRDPECQWTICDLFKQADAPELVHVGVVWQIDAVEDAAFVRVAGPNKRHKQVREVRIPWQEATGPCKARHLAQQLWDGEENHLQIDSHMRFVPGWDSKLKDMLQQAEQMASFGKAVISSYPPPYEGEGAAASLPPTLDPTTLVAQGFDQDGMLRLVGKSVPAGVTPGVVKAQFWAAGFSFSRAQLIMEVVPYDPDLPFLFFGEEMSMLARIWTSGWDVMAPTQAVCFHLWSRAYRHTFQADLPVDHAAKAASQACVKRLLGLTDEPAAQTDGVTGRNAPSSGLGSTRSLQDFWLHCKTLQY
ncbi:MAG: c transferase [Trebouxia sp. A1-2]|nr:MAG: c transferase [Trebouxia sp. A1-2]